MTIITTRGESGAAATSKMERFVIIVNDVQLPAVNYYNKALHLGCCSSPRSASDHFLLLVKIEGLRPATLLKKRICHRCFPVNFVKFVRTPFLLKISSGCSCQNKTSLSTSNYAFDIIFAALPSFFFIEKISLQLSKCWQNSKKKLFTTLANVSIPP